MGPDDGARTLASPARAARRQTVTDELAPPRARRRRASCTPLNALSPRKGSPVRVRLELLRLVDHDRAGLAPPRASARSLTAPARAARAPSTSPPASSGSVLMVDRRGAPARASASPRGETVVTMHGALVDLEPGRRRTPRFPRSHVVLPFLMGRRKGVRRVRERRVRPGRRQGSSASTSRSRAPRCPAGGARRPALMQIHGGGWVIGDKREQGIPLLNHMAAQGWVGLQRELPPQPGGDVPRPPRRPQARPGVDPGARRRVRHRPRLHLRHRRLGRRPPHRARWALTAERPALPARASRTPTRSVAAAVPFYGIYDFTADGAFGSRPGDLPAVPRAGGDEGVRRRGAREVPRRPRRSTTCTPTRRRSS